jgi:tRNA 2-thiouridine synthesizing protein E
MFENITTDAEGYLQNPADWTEALAAHIARGENIELTADHWEIIHFLREFYAMAHKSPGMRLLVKVLRNSLGEAKGNSIYLHQLFPKPALQANKIAGLPKPLNCI